VLIAALCLFPSSPPLLPPPPLSLGLGVLSWDENRDYGKYQAVDMKQMVRRDRHHPAIVVWSVCNEIECTEASASQGDEYRRASLKEDSTRALSGNLLHDSSGTIDRLQCAHSRPPRAPRTLHSHTLFSHTILTHHSHTPFSHSTHTLHSRAILTLHSHTIRTHHYHTPGTMPDHFDVVGISHASTVPHPWTPLPASWYDPRYSYEWLHTHHPTTPFVGSESTRYGH
jgi:beta-galactosidase/beta-glucuronidase